MEMHIHPCHRTGAGARHRPDDKEQAEPPQSPEAADSDSIVRPPAISRTESPAVMTFLASVSVLMTIRGVFVNASFRETCIP